MSTMLDLRRMDLRVSALENPYWITSANIVATAADDKAAVLFSFPVAGRNYFIHQLAFQLSEVFDSTVPVVTIGRGTILTDAVTTNGTVTDVDVDEYFEDAEILNAGAGTVGYYLPTTSDWFDLKAAQTASGLIISGLAAAVPCIIAYIANTSGTFTTGQGRLHVLISEMP
jgi:hypothetical protein